MTLHLSDVRWFSDLVLRLHACTGERELFKLLLPQLHQRFRSNITVAEEGAYNLSSYCVHRGIGMTPLPPDHFVALGDSPLVIAWQGRRRDETLHMLGLSGQRSLHRTEFYNVICQRVGVEDQLVGTFGSAPGASLNYSVNREVAFSVEEQHVMECLRRHVMACFKRTRPSAPQARSAATSELCLTSALQPFDLPANVRRLLRRYFPDEGALIERGQLPDHVRRWMHASLAILHGSPPTQPLLFLRMEGIHGCLFVRFFPARSDGTAMLRFTEELRGPSVFTLRHRGLTERECEVLHWMIAGKRDGEIGIILGCSGRTAAKHVETLLRKTSAGNRQAAANVGRRWLEERCVG